MKFEMETDRNNYLSSRPLMKNNARFEMLSVRAPTEKASKRMENSTT